MSSSDTWMHSIREHPPGESSHVVLQLHCTGAVLRPRLASTVTLTSTYDSPTRPFSATRVEYKYIHVLDMDM